MCYQYRAYNRLTPLSVVSYNKNNRLSVAVVIAVVAVVVVDHFNKRNKISRQMCDYKLLMRAPCDGEVVKISHFATVK